MPRQPWFMQTDRDLCRLGWPRRALGSVTSGAHTFAKIPSLSTLPSSSGSSSPTHLKLSGTSPAKPRVHHKEQMT